MSPVAKRVISCLIGVLTALAAVTAALPENATLASVPIHAWIMALLSGVTGAYSPSIQSTDKEEPKQ